MTQTERKITIPVKLDEKTFKRFARFDMLILRKKWQRPAIFAGMLLAFALIIAFSGREQSIMLSAVLLAVGLGLPLVYIGSFFSQVNLQALRQKLNPPRRVYTVCLGEEGIEVSNAVKQEEQLRLSWKEVRQAIRVKGCIYLYVSPVKAFLLPDGQATVPDEQVWAFLMEHMGNNQCANCRGGRHT